VEFFELLEFKFYYLRAKIFKGIVFKKNLNSLNYDITFNLA